MGMRHILVHDYFAVDTDIVWDVIERDLPDLKHSSRLKTAPSPLWFFSSIQFCE
jgi:uncharacterized protein with HEPN domain